MPHARIIAESSERARLVAKQLAMRGYSVEIVDPGIQFDSPADLEITVTADSALPFFAEEVYAAPGSILGLAEYEPEDKPAPEYHVLEEQPESAAGSVRAAFAQTRQAFTDGWRTIAGPLQTRWTAYRAARQQRAAAREQQRAEAARLRDEQELASRSARAVAEQELARRQAEEAEAGRMARIAAEQERDRRRAEQAEAARIAALEAARRLEQEQAEAARLARVAQEQEAARLRAETAEAARLAQIAEEKQRARRRALELEQQQLAARVDADQEQAGRRAEHEQAAITRRREDEKRRREEFLVAEVRRREAEERASAPPRQTAPSSPAERRWQAAFAAAAVVSAFSVLGLFFAHERRPAAPVSNRTVVESQAVEQQVPFGAATVPPAETVLKKAATAGPSESDAPRPRPRPRRVFRADSDQYAPEKEPEVVIRRRNPRPPQAGQQASGVKRITDDDTEAFEEEEQE